MEMTRGSWPGAGIQKIHCEHTGFPDPPTRAHDAGHFPRGVGRCHHRRRCPWAMAEPEDIAKGGDVFLASDISNFVTGQNVAVNGSSAFL